MTKVLMRSKSGAEADLPCGGTHPSVEEWVRRGWTVVEQPEPGFAPVSFAPATIDGPPPLDARGQDDVAHGLDAPNVTC